MAVPEAGADGETPVSKLFLSCDLTGSTAFKQRTDHDPQAPWQKVFLQFYREFPQTLSLLQVDPEHKDAKDLKFELWKPVGDELIMTCDVTRESDVEAGVRIWIAAMREYQRKSLSGEKAGGSASLGVKGGAFIATFPGPDSRSTIPRNPRSETSGEDVVTLNRLALRENDHQNYMFDYFGPSIDTGFRVFKECSARYFTLSLEVALVMARLLRSSHRSSSHDIVLLKGAELKGVWGGRTYPLFAVDLEKDDAVHRAFAKFDGPPNPINEILELCEACYFSGGWPFKIYLPEAGREAPSEFREEPVDSLADYVPETPDSSILAESPPGEQVPLREDAPLD